jgi:hypothetical protein
VGAGEGPGVGQQRGQGGGAERRADVGERAQHGLQGRLFERAGVLPGQLALRAQAGRGEEGGHGRRAGTGLPVGGVHPVAQRAHEGRLGEGGSEQGEPAARREQARHLPAGAVRVHPLRRVGEEGEGEGAGGQAGLLGGGVHGGHRPPGRRRRPGEGGEHLRGRLDGRDGQAAGGQRERGEAGPGAQVHHPCPGPSRQGGQVIEEPRRVGGTPGVVGRKPIEHPA